MDPRPALTCPHCQLPISGAEGQAGKEVRCPRCGQSVGLPARGPVTPASGGKGRWVWAGALVPLAAVSYLGGFPVWKAPPDQPPALDLPGFTNTVGMKLVRLPGGVFGMGSLSGEHERTDDEGRHEVEVSEFYLGMTEVTQGQFREVMGYNPSFFSKDDAPGDGDDPRPPTAGGGRRLIPPQEDPDEFPVENISWEEADRFCRKLNDRDRAAPQGWVYRLPREAEWEYACRGGERPYQTFHFGNSLSSAQANFHGHHPYGGAPADVYLARTTRVGSYQANAFGLCDMHGNVWEWCSDWYGRDYYRTGPRKDPPGPDEGTHRVCRGGSCGNFGRVCRSAARRWYGPLGRLNSLGFRVALVAKDHR